MFAKALPKRTSEDERIVGIIADILPYQAHYEILEGANLVDNGAAVASVSLGWVYYKKWRVAGIGMRVNTEAYSGTENPDMKVGKTGDTDLFGTLTLTVTTGTVGIGDVIMQETNNLLGDSDITPTASTLAWVAGDPNGQAVWQSGVMEVLATNGSNLTQGQYLPFIIIEIAEV